MMDFKVFGFRRKPQNPRRCSRGFPRSPRRRRRRYVILEKAMAFSFPVCLSGQSSMDDLTKDSRQTERTRQLHLLPRDDSNSRYRLCFAPSRPDRPVAGAVGENGESGRGLSPPTLRQMPKLNMRTSSVIHTRATYAGRCPSATIKFAYSELFTRVRDQVWTGRASALVWLGFGRLAYHDDMLE